MLLIYCVIGNAMLFVARLILWVTLLLSLFGLILPYISNVHSYSYLIPAIQWEIILNQFVKSTIPTKFAGFDLSRILVIASCIIAIDVVRTYSNKIKSIAQHHRIMDDFKKIQQKFQSKSPKEKEKIVLLENKLNQTKLAFGKNREDLLKEFANIKKELEKIGRDLVFLSIDVVNSTGMKSGEDRATVELDFIEYRNFVEAKFRENGLIKAAWTPDGVMACFNTVENALKAAQDILKGLEYFNRHVKMMKQDFVIRCGINGGHVFYDDSIPLEQFSDRVIDIAGHMQKLAPPNSILIAKQMVEPVTHRSRDLFTPTERIVDGMEVCEWTSGAPPQIKN